MKTGIYIHIPFCKSRCIYCGFFSTTSLDWQSRYTSAVVKELQMRRDEPCLFDEEGGANTIATLYFGGGTPSSLHIEELEKIVNAVREYYHVKALEEFTVEVNPDDVTPDFIKNLRRLGVDRVSMGIQTFDDKRLQFLHRRHTAAEACAAVKTVRASGISNVSIDLMYGFPGESLAHWRQDVETAMSLHPDHISAYSLMYEEKTLLKRMLDKGEIESLDDETCLEMYTFLANTLRANGYEHYEISNFCLPGKKAKHNSSYWNGTPYLGFGAAAHSYTIDRRSWNVANLSTYIKSIENGVLPSEHEEIDEDTHYNDLITTSMRTREGLDLKSLTPEYRDYALCNAKRALDGKLLEIYDDHLRLTRDGVFVSDGVMSDLIKI